VTWRGQCDNRHVRLWQAALFAVVVALIFSGSAVSTHDPGAKFAGNWSLDPNGRSGSLLRLRLVTDAAGIEGFHLMGVIDDRCDEPTIWYIGVFTTPNDHGTFVGCTWPRVQPPDAQALSGWYRSTNFSGSLGKIGKLDLPSSVEGGTFQAHFSGPGEYKGRLSPILMRFVGHFAGDGSGDRPTAVQGPQPLKRGHVTVAMHSGAFTTTKLEVANGTVLTLCNKSSAFRWPFSFPATGPNAFFVKLKPGACFSRKLTNAGKTRITMKVFDKLSNQAKLIIVIHPPGV
jgi:hypothetical protein